MLDGNHQVGAAQLKKRESELRRAHAIRRAAEEQHERHQHVTGQAREVLADKHGADFAEAVVLLACKPAGQRRGNRATASAACMTAGDMLAMANAVAGLLDDEDAAAAAAAEAARATGARGSSGAGGASCT